MLNQGFKNEVELPVKYKLILIFWRRIGNSKVEDVYTFQNCSDIPWSVQVLNMDVNKKSLHFPDKRK